jgi:hypothetical protein
MKTFETVSNTMGSQRDEVNSMPENEFSRPPCQTPTAPGFASASGRPMKPTTNHFVALQM